MKFFFSLLTRLAMRFRAIVIVLVLTLMALGVLAYTRLNQELLPPVEVPQTVILGQTSGMTSEQVLTIITQPLEDEISQVEDIINLESETSGSFGTVITAYNNFGIDQQALQEDLRNAVRNVWFPTRRLTTPDDMSPDQMLADLDAQTMIYLAESDPNFLFQLTPQTWSTLNDQTIETTLAYLAQDEEAGGTAANALQRLVSKEVVPQLESIEPVANVDVQGGETIPAGQTDEESPSEEVAPPAESPLLRLSPQVWDVVSQRVDNVDALDQSAVETLSEVSVDVPDIEEDPPPELPESWQQVTIDGETQPSYFFNAGDLLEVETLTQSIGAIINDFRETGEIIGALGQTNDLTIEVIEEIMARDPSMASYFEAEHVLALPDEVFNYISNTPQFLENMDVFARDAIAARQLSTRITAGGGGESQQPAPIDLPSAWQIQPPQVITFSFSDIPVATFSVSTTAAETSESDEEQSAALTTTRFVSLTTKRNQDDNGSDTSDNAQAGDAPLPSIFNREVNGFSIGSLFGTELKNTSDLLELEAPKALKEALSIQDMTAAAFFNLIANPPDIPQDQLPEQLADVNLSQLSMGASLVLGQLTPDNMAYLIENEEGFADSIDPAVIDMLGDEAAAVVQEARGDAQPADDQAGDEQTGDEEGPALNPEWQTLADSFADQLGFQLELDTADDLLNLPGPFSFNALAQQLVNTQEAASLLPSLFGNLPQDAARYLMEQQPSVLNDLPPGILVHLSDDVLSLLSEEAQARAPRPLPSAWNTLMAETAAGEGKTAQSTFTTQELISLDEDGKPSSVLNTLVQTDLPEQLSTYNTRLLDSLTPSIINKFLEQESDFFQNLEAEVFLQFSSDVINMLSEEEIRQLPNLNEEQVARTLEIREDPSESAFANLESLYEADIPPGDPSAPALSPGWQQVGDFYGIELDSVDDFYRFPDELPFSTASGLINNLFQSEQGANFAPQLLGSLQPGDIQYMLSRDENALSGLSGEALALMPEESLAELPQELQTRAEEGATAFEPTSQITRTNGNSSLFVTVTKDTEANTVSTYHDVESLMNEIDAENENINIGVVFEQASFIEDSISSVAQSGLLGAVFAVLIILIFLSGGSWQRRGRTAVGALIVLGVSLLMFLLSAVNLDSAGGDLLQAFGQVDIVLRILLIVLLVAGLYVLIWPTRLPFPSWRSTLVIAVSIPLAIMTALVGMYWIAPTVHDALSPFVEDNALLEFVIRLFPEELTLNIMTLSGLTVAIGRVVDDSIVVLENIDRELQKGGDKREAILRGARDVSAAIFTATLIAVVVFLPLGLTGGLIGAFFLPFGLAVTYALVGSFLVAITVVPVLAYLFISAEDLQQDDSDIWIAEYYRPVLRWSLRNNATRFTVIAIAIASIVFAFYLFSQRPFAFLPDFGEPQITVNVSMPSGTSILETNERVRQLEQWLQNNIDDENVTAIQTTVGGSGQNFETLITGGGVTPNRANVVIGIDPSVNNLDTLANEVQVQASYIFNACPNSDSSQGTPQRELMTTEEVDGIRQVVCEDGTEMQNNVDVQAASIAESGFGGFRLVVAGPMDQELNQQIIEEINGIEGLANAESNFVQQPEDGGEGTTNPTFIRVGQQEAFSYTAEVSTENTIGVTEEALTAIREIDEVQSNLCENGNAENCFSISQGFESEIQTEGFNSLGVAMLIAIGIVIVILTFTMQSFVYWLAIIGSILVAPVGASIALAITDRVLGISALIGLLMLIGLVIANAVVLIDRVRSNRRERGMSLKEALVEAGGRRLRPILMTSLATITALLPLAVGLSEGAIIASELGTVVIGGMVSSTLLTLIVVPVAFSLLSPLHRLLSIRKDAETRSQPSDSRDAAPAD